MQAFSLEHWISIEYGSSHVDTVKRLQRKHVKQIAANSLLLDEVVHILKEIQTVRGAGDDGGDDENGAVHHITVWTSTSKKWGFSQARDGKHPVVASHFYTDNWISYYGQKDSDETEEEEEEEDDDPLPPDINCDGQDDDNEEDGEEDDA